MNIPPHNNHPHVRRIGRCWWIIGTAVRCSDGEDDYMPVGPYDTRAEAEDDLRGLKRNWRPIQKPAEKPE